MSDPSANGEPDVDAWIAPRRAAPPAASLADVLASMPGPVFAALDGGQFDDLPGDLEAVTLKGRSLFLGVADPETEKAGPWLVDTDSEASLTRLLKVLGDKPAAVFWSCASGEAALYRHLRLLNEAIVPLAREDAEARARQSAAPGEPPALQLADYKDERVLFRHWDPRVLAQVLPVLDEAQFARVLGPAALVVMPREDGGRPFEAHALDTAILAPQGPLRLRPEQMAAISDVRVNASRRRIADYLREVAPERCAHLDERQLSEFIKRSEQSAAALGVRNERAFGLWAYMLVTSKGDFTQDAVIRRAMTTRHSSTADQRVEMLFDARLEAMRKAR